MNNRPLSVEGPTRRTITDVAGSRDDAASEEFSPAAWMKQNWTLRASRDGLSHHATSELDAWGILQSPVRYSLPTFATPHGLVPS